MTESKISRRGILKAAAALPLVSSLPSFAGTRVLLPAQRKFLFLMAAGGWDSTLVFDPQASSETIARLANSPFNARNPLQWTSTKSRPSVDRFFQRWGTRSTIINGLYSPALGHAAATNLMLCGDAAAHTLNWPSLLGHNLTLASESADSRDDFFISLQKAVERLGDGKSRCEFLKIPGNWDTHHNNAAQAGQFETFFYSLNRLFHFMEKTAGENTQVLLDEVIVVALSELGRDPEVNAAGGKHHWPYTSALISGPGIAGGNVVGLTNDALTALPFNFHSGAFSQRGDIMQGENLGATLLQLGGLPVSDHLQGVQSIAAVFS